MMISEEQVRRAIEYLRNSDEYAEPQHPANDAASAELVGKVVEALEELPDVRAERVAHARLLMEEPLPPSDELAAKLIGRVLSDSVR